MTNEIEIYALIMLLGVLGAIILALFAPIIRKIIEQILGS